MIKLLPILLGLALSVYAKDKNLLNDIDYKKDYNYQMIIEIPAGTQRKYELDKESGVIKVNVKKGKSRIIQFLPYPGNYGFIPQTLLSYKDGGDNDPIDILLISESINIGSIVQVSIIGAIDLLDRGERDTKVLAVPINGNLSEIKDLNELIFKYPNLLEILKLWFESYKGVDKMNFLGYNRVDTLKMIETSHKSWMKYND